MNRQILIIWLFCCLRISSAQGIKLSFPGQPTSVENLITEVAAKSENSGSLVVSGTCTEGPDGPGVAALLKSPPDGPFRNFKDALDSLVRADKRLTWNRAPDGKFRIRDSRVPDDILGIHLHEVRIDNALGGDLAIAQLMKAPEITAFFSKNSIETGLVVNHLGGAGPGLPRYTAELHDTTLAAALDRIIAFYPGVWIYSECNTGSKRRVMIRSFEVRWPAKSDEP